MTIGRHDGVLHQGSNSTRAWKSVTVCWMDLADCAAVPLPIALAKCTTKIEAIRKAFPVVFKEGVPDGMTAKERNARLGDYIENEFWRAPLHSDV